MTVRSTQILSISIGDTTTYLHIHSNPTSVHFLLVTRKSIFIKTENLLNKTVTFFVFTFFTKNIFSSETNKTHNLLNETVTEFSDPLFVHFFYLLHEKSISINAENLLNKTVTFFLIHFFHVEYFFVRNM